MDGKTLASRSASADKKKVNFSDIVHSSLDNRFVQNQLIRQGTSAVGIAAVAAGSSMIKSGSAPRTEFRSHLQLRDTTGKKTFKPYTWRGRTYSKPLSRRDYGGQGAEYGYKTDYKSRTIKKSPSRVSTGKVVRGLGRSAGLFGIALVGYNIHRHGVKKTVKDEAEFNWSVSPIGIADEYLLGNRLENQFLGKSSTPYRTVDDCRSNGSSGGIIVSKKEQSRCDRCGARPSFRNWIESQDVVHYKCICGFEWVE